VISWLQRRLGGEDGIALVAVLGLVGVLAILTTGLLGYGISSMRQARHDQDWNASLASAEAGIDDFLYRINADSNYWQKADPASGAPDPANTALSGFVPIPGDVGSTAGSFTYTVDASQIGPTGNVIVESTGRVNGVDRTVRATVRRAGFLDFLYFTDFETIDPTAYPSSQVADKTAKCSKHLYEGRSNSECQPIYWYGRSSGRDVVQGPFHTNDTIQVNGTPQWTKDTSTSWKGSGGKHWVGISGVSNSPTFPKGDAEYRGPLDMPDSNGLIKAQADPVVAGRGCMYAGPTYIELVGNKMRVTSRATDAADPPGTTVCKTNGSLQPIPENGVVYVRNASPSEPASSKPHPYDTGRDGFSGSTRREGDVYVEGNLDGRLTIASEDDVILVGNVTYAGGRSTSSDDMLGLVANNFVEIYHPVTSGGDNVKFRPSNKTWHDVRIDAALLSVTHSFRVQNYSEGNALGEIDLHGAMAQIFRGPVGTSSGSTQATGYLKDYKYDDRLKFMSPPHYLDPVKSAWAITEWSIETS
jgi:hypothetical protein